MPDAESRWLRSDTCDFMRLKYMIIADGHGSSMEYKLLVMLRMYVIVTTCVLFIFVAELGDIRTTKTIYFAWNKHYLIWKCMQLTHTGPKSWKGIPSHH